MVEEPPAKGKLVPKDTKTHTLVVGGQPVVIDGVKIELGSPPVLIDGVAPIDSANFALCCAVWLQLDAAPEMSLLDKGLRECATPDAIILSICNLLEGGIRQRLPLLARRSYLRHLILLVHRHVRPAEDTDHRASYSPNTRDEAARFRNGVLVSLAQIDDPI